MPAPLPCWRWLSTSAASSVAAAIAREVAGEVQVDVGHRRHLGPDRRSSAALHAEHRTHRTSRRQAIDLSPPAQRVSSPTVVVGLALPAPRRDIAVIRISLQRPSSRDWRSPRSTFALWSPYEHQVNQVDPLLVLGRPR